MKKVLTLGEFGYCVIEYGFHTENDSKPSLFLYADVGVQNNRYHLNFSRIATRSQLTKALLVLSGNFESRVTNVLFANPSISAYINDKPFTGKFDPEYAKEFLSKFSEANDLVDIWDSIKDFRYHELLPA